MDATSLPVRVFADANAACECVAYEMAELVRSRAKLGRAAVLGLATGTTPLAVYRELVRMHADESLDFSHVVSFNLDEFVGIAAEHAASFRSFMKEHLFDLVNIPSERAFLPSGVGELAELQSQCAAYEKEIQNHGGIDFQLLGIGTNGHIGFNEPGAAADSRTHVTALASSTLQAYAGSFADDCTPQTAVTMGIGTILEARKIVLLALGKSKAPIVQALIEGPVTSEVPASYLKYHPDARIYLDESAASLLNRDVKFSK